MAVRALVVALSIAGGCGSPPPSPPSDVGTRRDAGSRDGGSRSDGGGLDAAFPSDGGEPLDAPAPTEGGVIIGPGMMFDTPPPMDAGPPFTLPDAGSLPADAGERSCTDPVTGAPDACLCPPVAYPCAGGMSECPLGTACVSTGCGTDYCIAAGTACESDLDCAAGSRCARVYDRLSCVPLAPTCADSRDCPMGHACEPDGAGGRRCVDRRIPCDVTVGCPRGYFCRPEPGYEAFCQRGYQRCSSAAACWGRSCSDLDGDGLSECGFPDRACATFGDCPAGSSCALAVLDYRMECGSHGPCRTAADCPAGDECVDLWGDGVTTCEPAGGSCAAGTCPPGTLCGSPISGGPPACLDRP